MSILEDPEKKKVQQQNTEPVKQPQQQAQPKTRMYQFTRQDGSTGELDADEFDRDLDDIVIGNPGLTVRMKGSDGAEYDMPIERFARARQMGYKPWTFGTAEDNDSVITDQPQQAVQPVAQDTVQAQPDSVQKPQLTTQGVQQPQQPQQPTGDYQWAFTGGKGQLAYTTPEQNVENLYREAYAKDPMGKDTKDLKNRRDRIREGKYFDQKLAGKATQAYVNAIADRLGGTAGQTAGRSMDIDTNEFISAAHKLKITPDPQKVISQAMGEIDQEDMAQFINEQILDNSPTMEIPPLQSDWLNRFGQYLVDAERWKKAIESGTERQVAADELSKLFAEEYDEMAAYIQERMWNELVEANVPGSVTDFILSKASHDMMTKQIMDIVAKWMGMDNAMGNQLMAEALDRASKKYGSVASGTAAALSMADPLVAGTFAVTGGVGSMVGRGLMGAAMRAGSRLGGSMFRYGAMTAPGRFIASTATGMLSGGVNFGLFDASQLGLQQLGGGTNADGSPITFSDYAKTFGHGFKTGSLVGLTGQIFGRAANKYAGSKAKTTAAKVAGAAGTAGVFTLMGDDDDTPLTEQFLKNFVMVQVMESMKVKQPTRYEEIAKAAEVKNGLDPIKSVERELQAAGLMPEDAPLTANSIWNLTRAWEYTGRKSYDLEGQGKTIKQEGESEGKKPTLYESAMRSDKISYKTKNILRYIIEGKGTYNKPAMSHSVTKDDAKGDYVVEVYDTDGHLADRIYLPDEESVKNYENNWLQPREQANAIDATLVLAANPNSKIAQASKRYMIANGATSSEVEALLQKAKDTPDQLTEGEKKAVDWINEDARRLAEIEATGKFNRRSSEFAAKVGTDLRDLYRMAQAEPFMLSEREKKILNDWQRELNQEFGLDPENGVVDFGLNAKDGYNEEAPAEPEQVQQPVQQPVQQVSEGVQAGIDAYRNGDTRQGGEIRRAYDDLARSLSSSFPGIDDMTMDQIDDLIARYPEIEALREFRAAKESYEAMMEQAMNDAQADAEARKAKITALAHESAVDEKGRRKVISATDIATDKKVYIIKGDVSQADGVLFAVDEEGKQVGRTLNISQLKDVKEAVLDDMLDVVNEDFKTEFEASMYDATHEHPVKVGEFIRVRHDDPQSRALVTEVRPDGTVVYTEDGKTFQTAKREDLDFIQDVGDKFDADVQAAEVERQKAELDAQMKAQQAELEKANQQKTKDAEMMGIKVGEQIGMKNGEQAGRNVKVTGYDPTTDLVTVEDGEGKEEKYYIDDVLDAMSQMAKADREVTDALEKSDDEYFQRRFGMDTSQFSGLLDRIRTLYPGMSEGQMAEMVDGKKKKAEDDAGGMSHQQVGDMLYRYHEELERLLQKSDLTEEDQRRLIDLQILETAFGDRFGTEPGGIEDGEVIEGTGTLQQLESLFGKVNTVKADGDLMNRVIAVADKLGVKVRFISHGDILNAVEAAGGDPNDGVAVGYHLAGTVYLDASALNTRYLSNQTKATAILHELMHSVTTYAMEAADHPELGIELSKEVRQAVLTIDSVYERIKSDPKFFSEYGIDSKYEMVAEISNPSFRQKLQEKGLWVTLKDAIKQIVGIAEGDAERSNAYKEVSDALDVLLDNYDPEAFNRWYQSKAGSEPEPEPLSGNTQTTLPKKGKGPNPLDKSTVPEWRDMRRKYKNNSEITAILDDLAPRSLEEVVVTLFNRGFKIMGKDEDGLKGMQSHTGYGTSEQRRIAYYVRTKAQGGLSPEKFGERVLQAAKEEFNIPFDEMDANAGLNAVLEVLSSVSPENPIKGWIERARIRDAEEYMNEQLRLQDEYYLQNYGMTADEYHLDRYGMTAAEWQEKNGQSLFMFIGKKGKERLDETERKYAQDMLSTASEMEKEGADPRRIKLATGFERGKDGQWRYEVGDIEFKSRAFDMMWDDRTTLADVLQPGSEAMKAYPELADVHVGIDTNSKSMGRYVRSENKIYINPSHYFAARKSGGQEAIDAEESLLDSVINHEVQHWIQDKEGFARGGSPREEAPEWLLEQRAAIGDTTTELGEDDYDRLAGEVEARNTEDRVGMQYGERRGSLATDTESVPRDQQIVITNAKQKMPGQASIDIDINDVVEPEGLEEGELSLSRRNRDTISRWLDKREDLDDNDKKAVLGYLDEQKDPKLQLAAGRWYAKGTVRFPEDMEKIEQAVELAGKMKVDPMQYDSPTELLDTFASEIKEKPIDPNTVPTLHKAQELPEGIVVYDVDDSEASRKNMRRIIDTHFGVDAQPWCLLQSSKSGRLTLQSKDYWYHEYNAYPKQVAFKNGKLIAFSANSTDYRTWWNRQDQPYDGIPLGPKQIENGRMRESYMMPDGSVELIGPEFIGNKQNGEYTEWYGNGQICYHTNYKDGKRDGLLEMWYEGGQMRERSNWKDGIKDGLSESWFENGQMKQRATWEDGNYSGLNEAWWGNGQRASLSNWKDGKCEGPYTVWHHNGQMTLRESYKNGKKNGLSELWYDNGQMKEHANYKNNKPDGLLELWSENGQILSRENWKNGKKNGLSEAWWGNGHMRNRSNWKNGKRDGLLEDWNSYGNMSYRANYKDGILDGLEERFNNSGDIIMRTYWKDYKKKELPLDGSADFKKIGRAADDLDDALKEAAKQDYGSGDTSLRQVAAALKKIDFEPGTENLDMGGGKYDVASEWLKENRGVTNYVYDPYNRDAEHNREIFDRVEAGGFDTTTSTNVLNVINTPGGRSNVILQCAKALKPGGTAYFSVYEGNGSGVGKISKVKGEDETSWCWQENRKTADYLDEVKQHFGDVQLKGKVIVARDPQTEGKVSMWNFDAAGEASAQFKKIKAAKDYDTPEEFVKDYEEVGEKFKNLNKGSLIERGGTLNGERYDVGKIMAQGVYVHKDYANERMKALEEKGRKYLPEGFEYNCLFWSPAKPNVIRFDEAPGFDTEREPYVGRYIAVDTETGKIDRQGDSKTFWHGKWQWVGNDYKGFDVKEAYEWQRRWAGTLKETADGRNMDAWNAQLDRYGLPRDNAADQPDFMFLGKRNAERMMNHIKADFNKKIEKKIHDETVDKWAGSGKRYSDVESVVRQAYGMKYSLGHWTYPKDLYKSISGEQYGTVLDDLATAESLEKEGIDPLEIKVLTNWERGADGQWRYEIMDPEVRENKVEVDGFDKRDFPLEYKLYNIFKKSPAIDIIDDYKPKLSVKIVSSDNGEITATTTEGFADMIIVNVPRELLIGEDGKKYVNTSLIAPVLCHEMQHLIQNAGGLAKGGAPGSRQARNYDEYKRLAGEVEARNVADRYGMSAEERRNSLASSTEDTPRNRQRIFLGGEVIEPKEDESKKNDSVQEWFYDNGSVMSRQTKEGDSILNEEFYTNGNLRYRYHTDKNGNENGLYETFDKDGNVIERLIFKNGSIVKGLPLDGSADFKKVGAPVFYSNAERTASDLKMEKAPADQWLTTLQNKGLKAEEDKWMGLSDWLKQQGRKKITKQDVLDYIRQNTIQVQDVNYSENAGKESAANERELREAWERLDENWQNTLDACGGDEDEAMEQMRQEYGDAWDRAIENDGDTIFARTKSDGDEYEDPEAMYKVLGLEMPKEMTSHPIHGTRLRFSTYGLKDKREIALVVPGIEKYDGEMPEIHFNDDYTGGRAIAWSRFGTATDAKGRKILVIDEIQSQRHQDARALEEVRKIEARMKEKYGDVVGIEKSSSEMKDVMSEEDYKAWLDMYAKNEAVINYVFSMGQDIPDAPFRHNWHELAMKRMLRLAAEEGYDAIAWTTGKQQAERYGMGDVTAYSLTVQKEKGKDTWTLIGRDDEMNDLFWQENVKDEDLAGIIGKENAEEILGGKMEKSLDDEMLKNLELDSEYELFDVDIKGSESGMKGFYDQMIPKFMDKYGKKWGVKTHDIKLNGVQKEMQTMHSVDVTDEMKQSVTEYGQPLFKKIGRDDDVNRIDELGREGEKLRRLGNIMGLDVNVVDKVNNGLSNGMIIGNKVYIQKGNNKGLLWVASHETGHWLKRQAGRAYGTYKKAALAALADKGVDLEARIADLKAVYRDKTRDELEDEIVNDAIADIFTKEGEMDAFIERTKNQPGIWGHMLETFKDFVNRLRGRNYSNAQKAYKALQVAFNEAADKADAWDPRFNEVILSRKGDPMATFNDGLGDAQFNHRTWNEGGRDQLKNWLEGLVKKGELSKTQSESIFSQMDKFYRFLGMLKEDHLDFNEWSDQQVVLGADGKPVFSVKIPNSEYKMNFDFSLVCKKRRALDKLLNELINRGLIDDLAMSDGETIVEINNIIREHGLETSCGLCFVDAKRFRVGAVAKTFSEMYNEMIDALREGTVYEADYFNFGRNRKLEGIHPKNLLSAAPTEELNWKNVNALIKRWDMEAKKKAAEEAAKAAAEGKKVTESEAKETENVPRKILKYLKAHPEGRRYVANGDYLASEGFRNLAVENPQLLKLYNAKKGTGGPKASQPDNPWFGEIRKRPTAFRLERAFAVGGVRLQSFSDFVPKMIGDYLEMFAEMAGRGLPMHTYTKEELFVRLFGLTGNKINMSLVPDVVDGCPAGLDANGDYVMREGQTFPWELAMKYRENPLYEGNVGTILVGVSREQILKAMADPRIDMIIPYHKSSINPIIAIMNHINAFTDYTDVQNTRYADNGNSLTKEDRRNEKNFNEFLRKLNDPRAAAEAYVRWCEDARKHKGRAYLPKFDEFAYERDADGNILKDEKGQNRVNPNYYKLLTDFRVYGVDKTGKEFYSKQKGIKFKFGKDVFDVIRQALDEHEATIKMQNDELEPVIADVMKKLGPQFKKVGSLTEQQVEAIEMITGMKGEDAIKQFGLNFKIDRDSWKSAEEKREKYINSKAFKQWFGDWKKDPENASKVVDADGKPMIAYHGTDQFGFTVFNTQSDETTDYNIGSHFGSLEAAQTALGWKHADTNQNEGFYAVYLDIKNPYEIGDVFGAEDTYFFAEMCYLADRIGTPEARAIIDRVADFYKEEGTLQPVYDSYKEGEDLFEAADEAYLASSRRPYLQSDRNTLFSGFRELLKAGGYDGIKYWNDVEGHGYCWVALEPEQIKSATDNIGTFQGPDIQMKRIATDAEYQDAVKNDKEKAKRMLVEAAKAAMPNTKVVDENGKPLEVYHGTKYYGFNTFYTGYGMSWFSTKEEYANKYSSLDWIDPDEAEESGMNSGVYNLYLDIKNPIQLGDIGEGTLGESFKAIAKQLSMSPQELREKCGFSNDQDDYIFDLTRTREFSELIRSKGFDGAVATEGGVTTFGAIDPNQIKSAELITRDNSGNVIPLSERFNEANKDIRFKKVGSTDSKEFKNWFGDWDKDPENASKVVDGEGKPLVVYHGTEQGGFNRFRRTKGNIFASGIYFTERGPAEDYANTDNPKEITSFRDWDVYDDSTPEEKQLEFINKWISDGESTLPEGANVVKDENMYKFVDSTGNALKFDDGNDMSFGSLKLAKYYLSLMQKNPQKGIYAVYLNMRNPLVFENENEEPVTWDSVPAEINGVRIPDEFIDRWGTTTTDKWAEYLQSEDGQKLGYDGLIFKEIFDTGSTWDGRNTDYIVFSPNQVKSVYNRGTWSNASERIDFKVIGNTDSKEFKDWFKKSKAVDPEGKPLEMYHGTQAEFDTFDREFIGGTGRYEGSGFNFSSSEMAAENYANGKGTVKKVYLSMQNPLLDNKKTITKAKLRRLIQEVDRQVEDPSYAIAWMNGYMGRQDDPQWKKDADYRRALDGVVDSIYEYADSDADIYASLSLAAAGNDNALIEAVKRLGFDGVLWHNSWNDHIKTAVVFDPEQVKYSDNQTWDGKNPNMRFMKVGGFPQRDPGETAEHYSGRIDEFEKWQDEVDQMYADVRGANRAKKRAEKRLEDMIQTKNTVIQEIKDQLKGNVDSVTRSELNRLLYNVQNAKPGNLASTIRNVHETVLRLKRKANNQKIASLLSTKVQDVNGRNMSIAKTVSDSVRRVFEMMKKSYYDIENTGLEEQMTALRREKMLLEQNIRKMENTIRLGEPGTDAEAIKKDIEEARGRIDEARRRLGELQKERDDIMQAKAEGSKIDVEDLLEALDAKEDRAAEGTDTWTQEDSERKVAYQILQKLNNNRKLDTYIDQALHRLWYLDHENSEIYQARRDATPEQREILKASYKRNKDEMAAVQANINAALNEQVNTQNEAISMMEDLIKGGHDSLLHSVEEEHKRKNTLIKYSLRDAQEGGTDPGDVQRLSKRGSEGTFKHWFTAPLASFEYMAQRINRRTFGKDGWFYKYFVTGKTGVIQANNDYLEGMRDAKERMEAKTRELFGLNWDDAAKRFSKVEAKSGVYVTDMRPGRPTTGRKYEKPMSKGQAAYVYMVWKMDDGRSKLINQGYDDDSISEIRDFIGDSLASWCDWIQEDFLKVQREKYNQKYREMYNTSMKAIEHYIPLKIEKSTIWQPVNTESGDINARQATTLDSKTGSLINRKVNLNPVDDSMSAFDVVLSHVNEMEEWNAFTRVRRDMDYVLSNTTFRNQLNANAKGQFNELYQAAAIAMRAVGQKDGSMMSQVLGAITKGIVGGNIAYRINTALKQTLSVPAFFGYSQDPRFLLALVRNIGTGYGRNLPVLLSSMASAGYLGRRAIDAAGKGERTLLSKNIVWCMEHIPDFRERISRGTIGNPTLDMTTSEKVDKIMNAYLQYGMVTNQLVDAITCSIGIKTIYDYKKARLNEALAVEWRRKRQILEKQLDDRQAQIDKVTEEVLPAWKDYYDGEVANGRMTYQEADEAYNKRLDEAEKMIQSKAEMRKQFEKDREDAFKEADRMAIMEADLYYNGTQQSNHQAFMSQMQMSRDIFDRMLSAYQNASIGYARKLAGSVQDLNKSLHYRRIVDAYTEDYEKQGYDHETAVSKAKGTYWNQTRKDVTAALLYGIALNWLWDYGGRGLLGFFQEDDDDEEKTMGEKALEDLGYGISLPMRGMPGMNLMSNFIQGNEMSPLMAYTELEQFKQKLDKAEQNFGLISQEVAWMTFKKAARFGGVDLDVWTRYYLGVEGLIRNGLADSEDDMILDLMFFLNTPNSQRVKVAKKLYKNRPQEEYVRDILRASEYLRELDDPWVNWIPTDKILSSRKGQEIYKEWLKENTEIDMEKLKRADKEAAKEISKMKRIDEVMDDFNNTTDQERRKELEKQARKLYKEDSYNVLDFESNMEDIQATLSGNVVTGEQKDYYLAVKYAADIADELDVADIKKSLTQVEKTLKEMQKSEAGAMKIAEYRTDHAAELRFLAQIKAKERQIRNLKKAMNGNKKHDQDLLFKIQEIRSEIIKQAREGK